MKKVLILILSFLMIVMSSCSSGTPATDEQPGEATDIEAVDEIAENSATASVEEQLGIQESDYNFDKLNDPDLPRYIEDTVYSDLVYRLADEGYFIENVEAKYISEEYLEELEYNSKENVYFGYTLTELIDQFDNKPYIFTLGDDGNTVVQEFVNYDDTYEKAIKNVAVGTGVILICVTVSAATGGAAPAISMIFATSAKTGAVMALSSGAISGTASGIITGIKTKDFNAALKSAASAGSESFKIGAITGVLAGGAGEAWGLHSATANGLSLNEAAIIQKESKYPLDIIKQIHSMDEYQVYKDAGLTTKMINGKTALVKEIDLDYVSDVGGNSISNLERMKRGLAPIDPATGKAYQLHHIGQKADGTLAVLTEAEHDSKFLHIIGKESEIDRVAFDKIRKEFWKDFALKAAA